MWTVAIFVILSFYQKKIEKNIQCFCNNVLKNLTKKKFWLYLEYGEKFLLNKNIKKMINKVLQRVENESKGLVKTELCFLERFFAVWNSKIEELFVDIDESNEKKYEVFYFFKNCLLDSVIWEYVNDDNSLKIDEWKINKDSYKSGGKKVTGCIDDNSLDTIYSLMSYITRPRLSILIATSVYYTFFGYQKDNRTNKVFFDILLMNQLKMIYEYEVGSLNIVVNQNYMGVKWFYWIVWYLIWILKLPFFVLGKILFVSHIRSFIKMKIEARRVQKAIAKKAIQTPPQPAPQMTQSAPQMVAQAAPQMSSQRSMSTNIMGKIGKVVWIAAFWVFVVIFVSNSFLWKSWDNA